MADIAVIDVSKILDNPDFNKEMSEPVAETIVTAGLPCLYRGMYKNRKDAILLLAGVYKESEKDAEERLSMLEDELSLSFSEEPEKAPACESMAVCMHCPFHLIKARLLELSLFKARPQTNGNHLDLRIDFGVFNEQLVSLGELRALKKEYGEGMPSRLAQKLKQEPGHIRNVLDLLFRNTMSGSEVSLYQGIRDYLSDETMTDPKDVSLPKLESVPLCAVSLCWIGDRVGLSVYEPTLGEQPIVLPLGEEVKPFLESSGTKVCCSPILPFFLQKMKLPIRNLYHLHEGDPKTVQEIFKGYFQTEQNEETKIRSSARLALAMSMFVPTKKGLLSRFSYEDGIYILLPEEEFEPEDGMCKFAIQAVGGCADRMAASLYDSFKLDTSTAFICGFSENRISVLCTEKRRSTLIDTCLLPLLKWQKETGKRADFELIYG